MFFKIYYHWLVLLEIEKYQCKKQMTPNIFLELYSISLSQSNSRMKFLKRKQMENKNKIKHRTHWVCITSQFSPMNWLLTYNYKGALHPQFFVSKSKSLYCRTLFLSLRGKRNVFQWRIIICHSGGLIFGLHILCVHKFVSKVKITETFCCI